MVSRLLSGRPVRPAERAEAFAPANIALVKYWGKRDAELNLPVTGSLSLSLGGLGSHTELRPAARDAFILDGERLADGHPLAERGRSFLDLFRTPECPGFAVATRNTIPTAAGLASSASGFAALVRALDRLFGWRLEPAALSILARLGSGSACRSVFEGFVEWRAGSAADGMDSLAAPLPERWPGLCLGLLVLCAGPKAVGSREAMRRTMESSPLYAGWPALVARDLEDVKGAIARRDFGRLGRAAEGNALAMHATMLAARPPVLYWREDSLAAIRRVQELRADGLALYLTMDAGPNLKLLFETGDRAAVESAFPPLQTVCPFG